MNIPIRASLRGGGQGLCPSDVAQVSPSGISQPALVSPENAFFFLPKVTISELRKQLCPKSHCSTVAAVGSRKPINTGGKRRELQQLGEISCSGVYKINKQSQRHWGKINYYKVNTISTLKNVLGRGGIQELSIPSGDCTIVNYGEKCKSID